MGIDVDSVIFVGKYTKDPEAVIRQIRSAIDDFKSITGQDAQFHNWAYYW